MSPSHRRMGESCSGSQQPNTYLCDDGNAAVEILAHTPADAARAYVDGGGRDAVEETCWIHVHVQRVDRRGRKIGANKRYGSLSILLSQSVLKAKSMIGSTRTRLSEDPTTTLVCRSKERGGRNGRLSQLRNRTGNRLVGTRLENGRAGARLHSLHRRQICHGGRIAA